ncbi:MAG: rRNA maturation RNase YbeY [Candidatus Polarisedimenticolaceae bacterium]|nr:rRNA maturation RNase YbeY [Candidatus Polarisedimenticolaceae bacterium]
MLDLQIASTVEALPSEQQILSWLTATMGEEKLSEITIRIVDERESQQLNHDYRGKERPTNVLSFSFQPTPGVEIAMLGDLVICAPVVLREATEQQKTAEAHWAHMVIHGTLHLLGYDHIEESDAETMELREQEILAQLGFPNPYL